MRRIEFIYFDAGGTLLRPTQPVGQTYAEIALHYGVEADADALDAAFKAAFRSMKPVDQDSPSADDDQSWWREVVQKTWEPLSSSLTEHFPFEDYFQEVYDTFTHPGRWRVFPDVDVVLEKIQRAGLRAGVLSNWDRRLRQVLAGLELNETLDPIIISSEHGVGKPHRRLFDIAEAACGLSAESIALVGDDPVTDGEGARAAGWTFLPINRPDQDLCDVLDTVLHR